MNRLNLLIITADQLHHDALGCLGNSVIRTPHIDRLAEEGVLFERAYCQAPICMASRASFHSGLYPHATGVRHNPVVLPTSVTTLGQRLFTVGYDTAGYGHLGGDGLERGFAHKVDLDDQPLRRSFMLEQERLLQGELLSAGACGPHPLPLEEQFDSLVGALAEGYLREARAPFYCQVDFRCPHIPWFASEPYASFYDPAEIWGPPSWRDDLADKPSNVRATRIATWMERYSEADLRRSLATYYGLISMVDDQVGRLLAALEARGLLERTVVLFAVDHGDYAGEFGLVGKTGQFYDCLCRVPWIIRAPEGLLPRGRRVSALVELVDLAPTVLELLALPRPAELQGVSRVALARGDTEAGAEAVFASTSRVQGAAPVAYDQVWDPAMLHPARSDPYSSGPCSHVHDAMMIRDACHKLTVYRDGGLELYDLQADPWERTNLAGRAEEGPRIQAMMARLLRWQMDTWPPMISQRPLAYHSRAASRHLLPDRLKPVWDAWQEGHP